MTFRRSYITAARQPGIAAKHLKLLVGHKSTTAILQTATIWCPDAALAASAEKIAALISNAVGSGDATATLAQIS